MQQHTINFDYINYVIRYYVDDLDYKRSDINMGLFQEAMIHESSKKINSDNSLSYERLEFLGDSIFRLIITRYFFERFDGENEGFLTKLRIRVERGDSMTELANILGLQKFIMINDFITDEILEDVFEAFTGAFYINFGIKNVKKLVINLIEKHKDISSMIAYDDNYKDILLRYYHQMQWGHPVYQEKSMLDAPNTIISIVKNPDGKIIGKGTGITKNKAEQVASKKALILLGVIKNNEIDDDWIDKIDKKKTKEKVQRKTLSIYNPHNVLITKKNVLEILKKYNVNIDNKNKFDIKTFHEATTHQSYVSRGKKNIDCDEEVMKISVPLQNKHNGRLKFLGNSMIHFIIGECLFFKYINEDEGFLTKVRSRIENADTIFLLSNTTSITKYVLVSQNIEILHGRNNVNILGAGFEAFIGALYIEFGFVVTRNFLAQVIKKDLNITEISSNETNYKHIILQMFNKNGWNNPKYRLISESGPDHLKEFVVGLYHDSKLLGTGTGASKKKASQIASKIVLESYFHPGRGIP